MSQVLKHRREQHFCPTCHSSRSRVCTDRESQCGVEIPLWEIPPEAEQCPLWLPLHLPTGPRLSLGQWGIGPGAVGVRGCPEGSKRESSRLGEAPLRGRFWSALLGPRRAPRGSFWSAGCRAPRDGLQPQPCFTLATIWVGSFLCKGESGDLVAFRKVKQCPRVFLKSQEVTGQQQLLGADGVSDQLQGS